eukprot:scaffold2161_cov244-Pinguiococcus_pyrenoidosus.AAC.12
MTGYQCRSSPLQHPVQAALARHASLSAPSSLLAVLSSLHRRNERCDARGRPSEADGKLGCSIPATKCCVRP